MSNRYIVKNLKSKKENQEIAMHEVCHLDLPGFY